MIIQKIGDHRGSFCIGNGWSKHCAQDPMAREIGTDATNHKELTIEYTYEGAHVFLQGDVHLADAAVNKLGLRRLIGRQVVAYFCYLCSKDPN